MGAPTLPRGLTERRGGVFYLHGSDEVRRDQAVRALVDAHIDPATRDFNLDHLRGSEVNPETLASVLGTPPMMAEWRVVVLRETEALAASPRARTLLLGVVEAPPPGLALILVATEPPGSTARFYKDLRRSATAVEFRPPAPNDLPGWLMEWSRDMHGHELAEDAARALAQAVGGDVSVLARELEKLATVVDEGAVITREVVEAAGIRIPRQDRWQWLDLVAEGRFREALEGLPVLLAQGESGVGLASALGTQLLRVGLVLDGGPSALAAELPPRQQFLVQRVQRQARHWTRERIRAALTGLMDTDRRLKSSALEDVHLVESWLLAQAVEHGRAAA